MEKQLGLLGALSLFGLEPEQHLGDNVIKIPAAMICLQGAGERTVDGKTYPMSSGVLLALPSPQLDPNVHELLIGTLYFHVEERYIDMEHNLRGHGLAGLATDGGFSRDSYSTSVGMSDLRTGKDKS